LGNYVTSFPLSPRERKKREIWCNFFYFLLQVSLSLKLKPEKKAPACVKGIPSQLVFVLSDGAGCVNGTASSCAAAPARLCMQVSSSPLSCSWWASASTRDLAPGTRHHLYTRAQPSILGLSLWRRFDRYYDL
jgi:hypothetical protein